MLNFFLFILIIVLIIIIFIINKDHNNIVGAQDVRNNRSPIPILNKKMCVSQNNISKNSLSSPKLFKYTTESPKEIKSLNNFLPSSQISNNNSPVQQNWFFNPYYHKEILVQQKYVMVGSTRPTSDEQKGFKYRVTENHKINY